MSTDGQAGGGGENAAILDASCLCGFARAGRLDALRGLLRGHRPVVALAVPHELEVGVAEHPRLADVRAAAWLEQVAVDGLDELRLFAQYVRLLGAGPRDIGECSSLAWAEAHGAVVVLDDQTAVNVARPRGVRVRRTLALVAQAVADERLGADEAARLVDELRMGGARFPCTGAEYIAWAQRADLF
ncbi:MAG: hypothetical protein HY744_02795 [Deltaproteobacteria bacterium]|nr:hypothetical protein [Deltaproteobacteria bacterium]